MDKKLFLFSLMGFFFVSIIGTLLHFAYDFSGKNVIVSLIAPINESIWEHGKLLFFPMLLYAFFMNSKLKTTYPCLSSALAAGILLGTLLIPVLFYTYSGILGSHSLFGDIMVFLISIFVSFLAIYRLTLSCNAQQHRGILLCLVTILLLCFFLFTFFPPKLALFISS